MTVDQIARICHEVLRGYRRSQRDFSYPAWAKALAWQKNAERDGVRHILMDPGLTAAQIHFLWKSGLEAKGWRYGEEVDPDRKEHPWIFRFEHLKVTDRLTFELFATTVKTLASLHARG